MLGIMPFTTKHAGLAVLARMGIEDSILVHLAFKPTSESECTRRRMHVVSIFAILIAALHAMFEGANMLLVFWALFAAEHDFAMLMRAENLVPPKQLMVTNFLAVGVSAHVWMPILLHVLCVVNVLAHAQLGAYMRERRKLLEAHVPRLPADERLASTIQDLAAEDGKIAFWVAWIAIQNCKLNGFELAGEGRQQRLEDQGHLLRIVSEGPAAQRAQHEMVCLFSCGSLQEADNVLQSPPVPLLGKHQTLSFTTFHDSEGFLLPTTTATVVGSNRDDIEQKRLLQKREACRGLIQTRARYMCASEQLLPSCSEPRKAQIPREMMGQNSRKG